MESKIKWEKHKIYGEIIILNIMFNSIKTQGILRIEEWR